MKRLFLACLVLSAASAANASGDIQAGQLKADTCMGCHGVATLKNAYPSFHVPKLGGQGKGYMVSAMQAYARGDRNHPTMQGQARSLSDEDIADIAAWFSNLADIQ